MAWNMGVVIDDALAIRLATVQDGRNCNSCCAVRREEDSVVAAPQPVANLGSVQLFHITRVSEQKAVNAVENVERCLAVNAAKLRLCSRFPTN